LWLNVVLASSIVPTRFKCRKSINLMTDFPSDSFQLILISCLWLCKICQNVKGHFHDYSEYINIASNLENKSKGNS
jgi:hypothetical protein